MINKTVLVATLILASSAGLPALAGSPPATFNVSLDGRCDVFKLKYQGFSVWGKHTGCKYNAIDGGTIGIVNGVTFIIANDVIPGTKKEPVQTWYFEPPSAPGARGAPVNQWTLFVSNGKKQVMKDQGTYTVLTPDAAPSAATEKPAAGER